MHCNKFKIENSPSCVSKEVSLPPMDSHVHLSHYNFATMPYQPWDDFSGPYKDYDPPGSRIPATGNQNFGDVPYLPSYKNWLNQTNSSAVERSDNLYFRGPFHRGVSETHTEYVFKGTQAREHAGNAKGRKRHYEKPGMANVRSVTHEDFQPPLPMNPEDKAPCLSSESPVPWYTPQPKATKNPHAKEYVLKTVQPGVVYVDDDPKRCFNTEHNENYVCYHKQKQGSKIKDPEPVRSEIFLEDARKAHINCKHPPPLNGTPDMFLKPMKRCLGRVSKRENWLLHPKNYDLRNGVLMMPCECLTENNNCYEIS